MLVALATCSELADLDDEGQLLLEALRAAGVEAEATIWDDPALDWQRFDRVVLRSTWDYPARLTEFLDWTRSIGDRLLNPPDMVAWNASKRYLSVLGELGLATVPSTFIAPGERLELPRGGELVVKPASSAGSVETARYRSGDPQAFEHARRLLAAGREVVVQPYLDSVDSAAETALIYLGGELSHAMRKGPLLGLDQGVETGLFREEEMSLREPSAAQVELGDAAIAAAGDPFGTPLYARVDMLDSDRGAPLILELELIEPSLFLDFHPPAAERLAALLAARGR